MNSELKKAYGVIESVIQEMLVMEEQALQGICCLLESENSKLKSKTMEDIISVLSQWNKIPASEIKAKVDEIKSNISLTTPDKEL